MFKLQAGIIGVGTILLLLCLTRDGECGNKKDPGSKKWRTDYRCGPDYKLANGDDAQCNPNTRWHCCAPNGWCGATKLHCECPKCKDYSNSVKIPTTVVKNKVKIPTTVVKNKVKIPTTVVKNKGGACLSDANSYRLKHKNTGKLTWDSGLAASSKKYAQKLLNDYIRKGGIGNPLKHDSTRGFIGENLWYWDNSKTGDDGFYCKQADKGWYGEIKYYSYSTAKTIDKDQAVGHFTQMIWKETQRVGYGIATAPSPKYGKYGNLVAIVVARYAPTGNFNMRGNRYNDYTRNVQPLK